jgi:hypothetical protein
VLLTSRRDGGVGGGRFFFDAFFVSDAFFLSAALAFASPAASARSRRFWSADETDARVSGSYW